MHGNTGNKNAKKYSDICEGKLSIRIPIRDKRNWLKCATLARLSLSEWVVKTLNSEVTHEKEPDSAELKQVLQKIYKSRWDSTTVNEILNDYFEE